MGGDAREGSTEEAAVMGSGGWAEGSVWPGGHMAGEKQTQRGL